jgi:predicted metal-dependent hydrolase
MEASSRYMVYLKNEKYLPENASFILSKSRNILREYKIIIRDVRVASGFLELDMSIPPLELEKVKSKLTQIGSIMEIDRIVETELDKKISLEHARHLFNNEKYWKTHEVLEGVWKNTQGDERSLLNGIILVAAALVHYQKGEHAVCISIMKRALDKLYGATGHYYDIDVDILKTNVKTIINSTEISKFNI